MFVVLVVVCFCVLVLFVLVMVIVGIVVVVCYGILICSLVFFEELVDLILLVVDKIGILIYGSLCL